MKLSILFLLCFFLVSTLSIAQNDKKQKDALNSITDLVGSQVGMNDVMGSLVKGIKTSSFEDGKSGKTALLSQLAGVSGSDYLKYASVAGSLAGALKGTSFLPGWADQKGGILDQLQTAGSIADVAGGVSGIFGLLNPSSLSSGFKKKQSSWSTALNVLSMLK